jgi:hypothetical protein
MSENGRIFTCANKRRAVEEPEADRESQKEIGRIQNSNPKCS